MKNIDPTTSITDVVMFNAASNVKIEGDIIKNNYPKFTVMCRF